MGHVHVHPEDGYPLNKQPKQIKTHHTAITKQIIH
jgi:hypothetical protein